MLSSSSDYQAIGSCPKGFLVGFSVVHVILLGIKMVLFLVSFYFFLSINVRWVIIRTIQLMSNVTYFINAIIV